MALNSTTYPNISRVVSGAAILSPNDGILLCNTSTAPVTMTLLEIPANYWQTTWRLYVLDNSNNAGTNNITISVPSGYTINNASTLVINTNGGGVVVTIASNTAFFGQVSPLPSGGGGSVTGVTASLPLSSSGGTTPNISITSAALTKVNDTNVTLTLGGAPTTSLLAATSLTLGWTGTLADSRITSAATWNAKSEIVAASNTGGTIVSACTNFKFDTTSFAVTNPSGTIAAVGVADTGWLDLQGFEFITPAASRPEYRVVGKMVLFRGTAVVPLASNVAGTTLIPMVAGTSTGDYYVNDPYAYTFRGTTPSNGCSINAAGSISFNRGNSVFQSALTLDGTYQKGLIICSRVVATTDSNTGVCLNTAFNVVISTTGVLTIVTYKDYELSPSIPDTGNGLGLGTLRPIIAKVNSGQWSPDYRFMTDTPTPSETNSSKSNTALDVSYSISTNTNTFLFDVDSSDEESIGGFQIVLDGLIGYLA